MIVLASSIHWHLVPRVASESGICMNQAVSSVCTESCVSSCPVSVGSLDLLLIVFFFFEHVSQLSVTLVCYLNTFQQTNFC